MEKETALEIEFIPVWDKWAWKVTKQNEDVLERGEFYDKELNVISSVGISFNNEIKRLFIRGIYRRFDNDIEVCTSEEKELIKEKVKAINEKYGIKKRWRAENEGYYYYIHSDYFLTVFAIDHRFTDDNNRYEAGNYFNTGKEAKEYAEHMIKKSLEWHEKRGRDE